MFTEFAGSVSFVNTVHTLFTGLVHQIPSEHSLVQLSRGEFNWITPDCVAVIVVDNVI